MSDPIFSVVIPWHANFNHLTRAVQSVLDQHEQSFEVLIVCNCKAIARSDKVKRYYSVDRRIKVLSCLTAHANAARNLGADNARGQFIAFLDADDEFLPSKLKAFASSFGDKNTSGFSRGQRLRSKASWVFPYDIWQNDRDVGEYVFCKGNFLSASALVVASEHFKLVRFDDTLNKFQDIDYLIRLQRAGAEIKMLPGAHYVYHDEAPNDRLSRLPVGSKEIDWSNRILSLKAASAFQARNIAQYELPTNFKQNTSRLLSAYRKGSLAGKDAAMMFIRSLIPECFQELAFITYARFKSRRSKMHIPSTGV